jgi:N-acetylglucosamine kinase-like BadF-type ATPase
MKYFLGVDGGQSSTTAVIGDETGRVIGIGQGGPSNHVGAAEGRAKFVNAIEGCVTAACADVGQVGNLRRIGNPPRLLPFTSACLGFSGGPADKESIVNEILSSERTLVTHDGLIALSGATAGQPGLITIAGTGSFAFGRNAAGETARAGGWGYIFGDEGGGFFITRQALRAALRFEEGWGAPTVLRSMFLEATGAGDINALLHRFYTTEFPRPRIAGFSKFVNEAAEAGDEIARAILNDAAQQLALIAEAVRRQLFETGEETLVAYVGGVFRSGILLGRFRSVLEGAGNRVMAPVYGPAAGALLEAYRAAGVACTLSNVPEEKS